MPKIFKINIFVKPNYHLFYSNLTIIYNFTNKYADLQVPICLLSPKFYVFTI